MLKAVIGDSVIDGHNVRLAYRDMYSGDEENPPIVLLLHGSPVGVPMFPTLIRELSKEVRVLAPDFPGYDGSDCDIPDYSIKALSVYMDQFLDKLQVDRAHLVGYSLGGGVAIEITHRFPEKVQSVDMLSAIGVQEFELMGSYHLNHAIHAGQLALIWMLHELVPHFGVLDGFPLNIPYARSFYDSDQRPLRSYLKEYRKPMLIQHGDDDGLVPLAAAKEHYRIVPQSEIRIYEGGHGLVISKAGQIAGDIHRFINSVENGTASTLSDASETRLQFAQQSFKDVDFAKVEGITLFVLMLIIAMSTLISEDLACIGAGLLAARGIIAFWPATAACFIGILMGDMGLYLAGRWLGRPAVRRAPFRWFVSENDLQRSADWFKAKGPAIIIASRFIPGSRLPTYFSAGMIGAGFFMFSFYFLVAALAWTPLLVGLSMLVGTELMVYFEVYKDYAFWVLAATVIILLAFYKFVFPLLTWKGRRLVLSRIRRIRNWEYWSPFLIYLPVGVWISWLAIKYRGLTTFTAANPAIEDGGFIGESKTQILSMFNPTGRVAAYQKLNQSLGDGEQLRLAKEFIQGHELSYPVVLKPDKGQRGAGVQIVRNERELRKYINQRNYDLIIQKYVSGEEYGVFYYRFPDQKQGSIFSITDKQLLTVTGDGFSSLEELILKDNRAVDLAKMHFRENEGRLYEVPEEGEIISLVQYGTHARGAFFRDGGHLKTEALRDRLDSITCQVEGYYFGRFDIRVPSEKELKAGKNLQLIEINGVTSEATSIYDPANSYWDAQRKLCRQWELAFNIGFRNRERGASTSRVSELIKKLVTYQPK